MINENDILAKKFASILKDVNSNTENASYETRQKEKYEKIKRKMGLTHGKGKRKKKRK